MPLTRRRSRLYIDVKPAPLRTTYKRWKLEDVKQVIRELVKDENPRFLKIEDISRRFKIKPGLVHQSLHLLRLEGLIGRECNSLSWYGRADCHWVPTIYQIITK